MTVMRQALEEQRAKNAAEDHVGTAGAVGPHIDPLLVPVPMTAIQRAAEANRLNAMQAPLGVYIDRQLEPGRWFLVRAMTDAERAMVNRLTGDGKR